MKAVRLLILLSLIFCCLLTVCSCDGIEALPAPSNVEIDEATLDLSWKTVKDARLYTIRIEFENGEVKEIISSKNSYSLSQLGVGTYSISVMAHGKEEVNEDSPWSTPKTFIREPEPGMIFTLINNNTEYEVTGKGIATGDIVIPTTYRGKPVTSIGKKAFFNKSDVDTVTLHEGITSIGEQAFANCSYLTSINLPENLTYIGQSAFNGCRLLSCEIVIPDGVTEIPQSAFAYCAKIPKVTIGKGVTTIGKTAFTDCKALTEIVIPSGVDYVSEYAFCNCIGVTDLIIENGITEFGPYVFAGNTALVSVVIPDSVKIIGEGVFYRCSELKNVTLGEGVEKIGLVAFDETKIWADSPTNEVYLGRWFLGLLDYTVSSVTIADGTYGIASYALYGTPDVSAFVVADSVKIIGDYAFAECSMNSVVIGAGVEIIGEGAFENSGNLTSVILGSVDLDSADLEIEYSSLRTIENYAFKNCSSLNHIQIPDTVKFIGSHAFRGSGIYEDSDGVVYADKWIVDYTENLSGGVIVPDGTVGIANYAFYQCLTITSISLPNSLRTIGRAAFYECSKLQSVALPETLEVIEDYTFYRCDRLKGITLPPMLRSIGRSAFYKCGTIYEDGDVDTDDDTLVIPTSVEYIGPYAFYGCGVKSTTTSIDGNNTTTIKGIDTVIMGDGVKVIEEYAFYGFVSLKRIVIGNGVEKISAKAFYKCESLEEVVFGSSVTEIGARAFYKCESLKAINLPDSVTNIAEYAFYKCGSVEVITLGNNVTSIGNHAFYGNSSLKTVVFPTSLKSIGRQAFRGCSSLSSVVIPSTLTHVEKHAFYGCTSLTIYTEYTSAPETFAKYWNSSYRPVVWGCTLSDAKDHVYSVTKGNDSVTNKNDSNTISAPYKEGFAFAGWATSSGATEPAYGADGIITVKNGSVLYAIWTPLDNAG